VKPSPGVESVEIVVHVESVESFSRNSIETTGEPLSVAVALSGIVARSGLPGFASETDGPVASTLTTFADE
jgi:hypothetical protein